MAKNWTIGGAVKAIYAGDKEAIMDIGKRFPLFLAQVAGMEQDSSAKVILEAIPARVTVRVIEANIRDGIFNTDAGEDDNDGDTEATPTPKAAAKRPAKAAESTAKKSSKDAASDDDYASQGAYKLYMLCKERGLDVKSKQDKQVYIDALAADDNDGGDVDDGADAPVDYSVMSAKELFNLCRERGMDCKLKQDKKVYVKLLEADDEGNDGSDNEDDGWGDDAEDEAPAKPAKSAPKADDEDWDI